MIEDDIWDNLLDSIDEGSVLPVVGWGVTTFGPDNQPLAPWLASELATKLGVDNAQLPATPSLNDVVSRHLMRFPHQRQKIFTVLPRILAEVNTQPGETLQQLAEISGFRLFLSSTPDSLLQKALDLVRSRGLPGTKVRHFSPGNSSEDIWEPLGLLAGKSDTSWVYHVLGMASRELDSCVVWDEDLLEFLLALNTSFRDNRLPNLFAALEPEKNVELLAIGVSYSDWLLRFFMRVMRQTRLTEDQSNNHLVPPAVVDPQNLVLYCGGPVGSVRVLNLAPQEFVRELLSRWRSRHPELPVAAAPPQLTIADEMPAGAIFVSYMREDEVAVRKMVGRLQASGCDVWLDLRQLKSGMNFDQRIKDYICSHCSLFISVISRETEQNAEGYVHRERQWARERGEGIAEAERDRFYHPLLIDDLDPGRIRNEPRLFAAVHRPKFLNGAVDDDFCQRIRRLQQERVASGGLR